MNGRSCHVNVNSRSQPMHAVRFTSIILLTARVHFLKIYQNLIMINLDLLYRIILHQYIILIKDYPLKMHLILCFIILLSFLGCYNYI